ncbi:MAG TPA: NADH-ubiquinone oxidoreductase-F iron-sulfur binding region domain-containing protein [Candidatus Syntrophosphaera sp.]|nr:NADH-ubiquinone oxidoreductase-F iron-sulfur binding region domain-containing protein [Candidatus Syntrophosphaera sp.]HPW38106.1 NADH-ubiquinone oxidoreductase-F iron-sulfur binding region domain-containing protein [Candidatus Syntrophosphaera sp.]
MLNLDQIKKDYQEALAHYKKRIVVCAGTGCIANGSLKIYSALKNSLAMHSLDVSIELKAHDDHDHDVLISGSGCQGFCQVGPLVTVEPDGILYAHVKPEDADEIVGQTIVQGKLIDRLLYVNPADGRHCKGAGDIPFYTRQKRTALKECGHLDPENVNEYISHGGYFAARDAYQKYSAEELCKLYQDSGLRGRGGGGFSTGLKWELTRRQVNEKKYIVCNGDEGDPGAFMDRSILEGNPHSVVEGMMIAAAAVGADEGYVYVRMEYPLACTRIRKAISVAEELGILGDNVFGSGKSFRISVVEGAGAFVCGEETALLASIEGKRGMPNPKPPFPAESGLYGKPTVINNVETLALVPVVMREGVEAFRKVGVAKSPGTKTFALTGHVANTGLIEVPFGTTLRQIIFEIGGGVLDKDGKINNEAFKAVQIGGPSGGCLTREHLDMSLDYDSLGAVGAMVGSGGLVVMNDSSCMVKIAHFFMSFIQNESCGKCTFCRIGTRRMLEILTRITEGKGVLEDIDRLEELSVNINKASLCGLGQTGPNSVLTTLRYFKYEYLAHIEEKRCPAGVCTALLRYEIIPEKCIGCTACARKCPAQCITGTVKQPHVIDQDKCIKCGSCYKACKFNAISKG